MVKKLAYCILFLMVGSALANESDKPPRLGAFEPNSFVYRGSSDNDRDGALRARYSFAYQLCNFGKKSVQKNTCTQIDRKKSTHSVYLSYTGEFDFYVNTRPSGPVVNRINNPALHYRYRFDDRNKAYEKLWIDVSLEHLSNGQAEDVSTPRGAERAAFAYSEGDYQYFDTISRGSNFLALETHYKKEISIYFKAKTYLDDPESEITWGELAGQGVSIKDYDRYKVVVRKDFGSKKRKIELAANWTLGDEFLDTDSFEVDFTLELYKIPFVLKYHNGPLMTLSNYALDDSYIGFGVKLVP